MECKSALVVLVLLLSGHSALGQGEASAPSIHVLHNSDVLRMHAQGLRPGMIISKIASSNCNFDIFPPVMRELSMRGIPETVLDAMKVAPYGPPAIVTVEEPVSATLETVPVQIRSGTVVTIAPANHVSSADVANGNSLAFIVTRRVLVNGVLVIERGAVAQARIIKSSTAGAWGRAGTFDFKTEYVVAVDGARIPIQLSEHVRGTNRTKAVTAAAIITGAIAFPYTPPVALLWALKKGDDAVLDEGTRFIATVSGDQKVAGWAPEQKKLIYHPVNTLKGVESSTVTRRKPATRSVRPAPRGHR